MAKRSRKEPTRLCGLYRPSNYRSPALNPQSTHRPDSTPKNLPPNITQLLNSSTQATINKAFYHSLTEQLLQEFYPKFCPKCNGQMTKTYECRSYAIYCPSCRMEKSRLSYTPLHHFKKPMWMFGWLFYESIKRYPNVVTSAEIKRKLGVGKNTALMLKRRFQLFCSHQTDATKELIRSDLKEKFQGFDLPPRRTTDLTNIVKDKTPVNIDSMAVFSASQRANKGRKRYRNGGLTASIYLNDSLGGKQIGSLYQTITYKGGPVLLQSIPDVKQDTIVPILQECIPHRVPVFSDEGYKFYYNPNHRMVNHSAKAKNKKHRWSKDRWSKNGVHCQVAEGIQSSFKIAVRNYRYYRPEHSQLYADEWCFLKNVQYFGVDKVAEVAKERLGKRRWR